MILFSSLASLAALYTLPVVVAITENLRMFFNFFYSERLNQFYHRPPKKPMTDDITGEPLIQRSDDNVETLRKRLASYHKQTAPVVDYYKAKGIWKPIDAAQSPPVVWESLVGVFNSAKKTPSKK